MTCSFEPLYNVQVELLFIVKSPEALLSPNETRQYVKLILLLIEMPFISGLWYTDNVTTVTL